MTPRYGPRLEQLRTPTYPAPLDAPVVEAAQRKVLRDCPDDFDVILDALGIG